MSDNRDVSIARCTVPEQLLQPNLPWRGVHEINAAYDLCHTLDFVVDYNRKMVGDQAVAASNNEITRFALQVLCHATLQEVVEGDFRVIGEQSDRCIVCITAISTGSGIDDTQGATWDIRKVTSGALAAVGQVAINERSKGRLVCCCALALEDDIAVPLEAVALQGVDYFLRSAGLLARWVDIFDTQQPEAVIDARL